MASLLWTLSRRLSKFRRAVPRQTRAKQPQPHQKDESRRGLQWGSTPEPQKSHRQSRTGWRETKPNRAASAAADGLGKPSGRGLRWGSAAEPQKSYRQSQTGWRETKRTASVAAERLGRAQAVSSALVCSFEFSAQLGSFGSAFGPALLHSAQLRSARLGFAFCPTLSSSGPLSALLLLRNSNPALSPTHNASLDHTRVPVGV